MQVAVNAHGVDDGWRRVAIGADKIRAAMSFHWQQTESDGWSSDEGKQEVGWAYDKEQDRAPGTAELQRILRQRDQALQSVHYQVKPRTILHNDQTRKPKPSPPLQTERAQPTNPRSKSSTPPGSQARRHSCPTPCSS
jgi:hypothetical protein